MSLLPNDRRDIERCLSAARDGLLSPEQAAWLSSRASESEEFAWLYLQLSHLEAALRWDFAASHDQTSHFPMPPEIGKSEASPQHAMPVVFDLSPSADRIESAIEVDSSQTAGAGGWWWFGRTPLLGISAISLTLAGLLIAAWAFWPRLGPQVATLSKSIEARWADDRSLAVGAPLHTNQTLTLVEGAVEVTYQNGASALVEAPAEFRLTSANSGQLAHGALLAVVPPAARGFSVETPLLVAVDLGTEFGVLSRKRSAEVHVFAGQVEVQPDEAAEGLAGDPDKLRRRRLAAGEAIVIGDGSVVATTAQRSHFITPDQPIRTPTLVGFYPLDGNARDASGAHRDASRLPNVKFVPGYEGQAAQLAGTTASYIELPIDAGTDALPRMTWGAWVRPTALGPSPAGSRGERNHVIFSTDNSRRSYDFDRTLTLDLRQGVDPNSLGQHRFASFAGVDRGVLANTDRDVTVGEWTFVAAAYDQPRRRLTLYVESPEPAADGKRLEKIELEDTNFDDGTKFIRVGGHAKGLAHPITRLGPLDAAESFYGEIDNVFVVDGCLTRDQLERIAAEGAEAILRFDTKQK